MSKVVKIQIDTVTPYEASDTRENKKKSKKNRKPDTAEEIDPNAMQNQKTKRDREHEPEARSQNAEIRKPCCAPPCIDRISSFMIVKKTISNKTQYPSNETQAVKMRISNQGY
jgi:hypothetical protein